MTAQHVRPPIGPARSGRLSFRAGHALVRALVAGVPLSLGIQLPGSTGASLSAPPQDVRLAALATLYALPIVVMDLTRQRMLAYPGAKANRFINNPRLANASSRTVVRPNVDTLYSSAWLDLSAGPMLLSLPPAHGEYFIVQCMDAWTNVFASPSSRTIGDRAVRYLIVGPNWHGRRPPGVPVIRAPTRMVWVLARIYVANTKDLLPARRFQSGLDIRPLSRVNDPLYHSIYPRAHPRAVGAPLLATLRRMGPRAYFHLFRRLERANPAVPPDPQFASRVLEPLGLGSGDSARERRDSERDRRILGAGYELALRGLGELERRHALLRRTSMKGWTTPGRGGPQGVFGRHYVVRAIVALWALAEGRRNDAVYFNAITDDNGKLLDGSRSYTLAFPPGGTPPVHAFWSLTLYDEQGFLVANPYSRYGVSSRDSLHVRSDGSLVIRLQPDRPASTRLRANWIPTPAGHSYQLTLRCYWPASALLRGHWMPPAIVPKTVTDAAATALRETDAPTSAGARAERRLARKGALLEPPAASLRQHGRVQPGVRLAPSS
jgi:hypothetical protein